MARSIRNPNVGFDDEFAEAVAIDLTTPKLKSETGETCLEAGFTVSSVVYIRPPALTVDTSVDFLLHLPNRVRTIG